MNEYEARSAFKDLVPILHEWGQYVDSFLNTILDESQLKERIVKRPEYRIKDENEFIRKNFWRNGIKDNPIFNYDKVGTRIVLISYEDVEFISNLIQTENKCIKFKEIKHPDFKNKLDYQAYHIILFPNKYTPGFEGLGKRLYQKLSCEIQIKTAVQDTLATIAHKTIYKGYYSNNEKIKDKFSDIAHKFLELELQLNELEKEMNTDSAHIKSFVDGLKLLGTEVLEQDFYGVNEDNNLSETIYQLYRPAKDVKIEDLRRLFTINKELVVNLFKYCHNYLLQQPISLFVIYLILMGRSKTLFSTWNYDADVLNDICRNLGYADDSLSY